MFVGPRAEKFSIVSNDPKVRFFCFKPPIHFLAKFGPTIQNFLFKVKFGTYNYFHHVLSPFNVLPNFPITTSEPKCDY